MGQSADAKLRYGVIIGGSESEWHIAEYDKDNYRFPPALAWIEDEDEGFADGVETRLLIAVGWTETYHEGIDRSYFDRKRGAQAATGVEVERFGTYDYPEYALVLREPDLHVNWGVKNVVIPEVEPGWDDKLTRACAILGFTPTKQYGWLLGAHYG